MFKFGVAECCEAFRHILCVPLPGAACRYALDCKAFANGSAPLCQCLLRLSYGSFCVIFIRLCALVPMPFVSPAAVVDLVLDTQSGTLRVLKSRFMTRKAALQLCQRAAFQLTTLSTPSGPEQLARYFMSFLPLAHSPLLLRSYSLWQWLHVAMPAVFIVSW